MQSVSWHVYFSDYSCSLNDLDEGLVESDLLQPAAGNINSPAASLHSCDLMEPPRSAADLLSGSGGGPDSVMLISRTNMETTLEHQATIKISNSPL